MNRGAGAASIRRRLFGGASVSERGSSRAVRDAQRRWWLSAAEIEYYGIDAHPELAADYLSIAAFHEVGRRGLARPRDRILDDKWAFAGTFGPAGLPVPTTYGLLHPDDGCAVDGSPLRSLDDLAAWCASTGTEELVLKPVAGWRSQGVVAVTGVDAGTSTFRVEPDGELTAARLADRLVTGLRGNAGYLVQELCHQDPRLAAAGLGPAAIVRVVTAKVGAAPPVVQVAVLHTKGGRSRTSSWQEGGLSIRIDVEQGTLGRGRTAPRFGTAWHTRLGDGPEFTGLTLPGWPDVASVCIGAAGVLPEVPVVCWEVLLTDHGVRLLEGNLKFGLTMMQVHGDGFLRDGTAARWQAAGAELPDGSSWWARRHGARIMVERARAAVRRRERPTLRHRA